MAGAIRASSSWILVEILPIIKTADGHLDRIKWIPEIGVHSDISLSVYLPCPRSVRDQLNDAFIEHG